MRVFDILLNFVNFWFFLVKLFDTESIFCADFVPCHGHIFFGKQGGTLNWIHDIVHSDERAAPFCENGKKVVEKCPFLWRFSCPFSGGTRAAHFPKKPHPLAFRKGTNQIIFHSGSQFELKLVIMNWTFRVPRLTVSHHRKDFSHRHRTPFDNQIAKFTNKSINKSQNWKFTGIHALAWYWRTRRKPQ